MSYHEIRAGNVKGRKDYQCEWCGENIPKGEKHFHRVYSYFRDFLEGRMHLECLKAMSMLCHDDLIDGWSPGEFKRGEANSRWDNPPDGRG